MKKWMLILSFAAVAFLGFEANSLIQAAEAVSTAAPAAAQATSESAPSLWQTILSQGITFDIASKGILLALGLLFTFWITHGMVFKGLIDDLHAGLTMAVENMTPELKAAFADGKLTKAEATQLRQDALKEAKDHMFLPARALALAYGQKYIGALIQRIINGRSNKNTPTATPAPDAPKAG